MFAFAGVGLVPQLGPPGWFSSEGPAPEQAGLQLLSTEPVGNARRTANLSLSEVLKRFPLHVSNQEADDRLARWNDEKAEEKRAWAAHIAEVLDSNCWPEFHVCVDRTDGSSLGIELEPCTDSALIVRKVNAGAIQDWNTANPDHYWCEENDLIVEANDVTGDVAQMLLECRKRAPLSIAIRRPFRGGSAPERRPIEFTVTLDKTQGARLGIDIDYGKGQVLLIEKIDEGLVLAWNKEHPDRQVLVHDCVVEVNGVNGDVMLMLDECKQDAVLKLTLTRFETECAPGEGDDFSWAE